jgi:peptide/nickel transport system permease protein
MFSGDLGPSLSAFPTPVSEVIHSSLPWTIGLLLVTTVVSWLIGNIVGGIAGYFSDRKWAKTLASFALVIYPIPYYVLSLTLILFLVYLFPVFPTTGGTTIGVKPSFSLEFIADVIYHASLPGLSLVIAGYGWWFISMRSIVVNIKSEDYVTFCKIVGLKGRRVLFKYVIRNCMLPQITALALSLGSIFTGAMATEVVFGYPGVGSLLYKAVLDGDYNLMTGIISYSILGVATAVLLLDLLYPLVDPRIRYK